MEKRNLFVGVLLASLLSLSVVPSTFAQTCNPDSLVPVSYGQRGAAVRNAQACLIEAGYDIPAGATGYYGSQTRTAVKAFYADWYGPWDGNRLGPKGVAELKSLLAGEPGQQQPITGGQQSTTGGQQDVAAIIAGVLAALQQMGLIPSQQGQQPTATSGEATVEVRLAASPASGVVIKEGNSADVLGVRVISKNASSDVQRVRFDLTSNRVPTKIFASFELYDGSTKLASVSAGDYTRTQTNIYQYNFTGFSVTVPAGGEKVLTIRAVVNPTVDSSDITGSFTVKVDDGYVRAVDGAGIQHTPNVSGAVSRTFTVEKATISGVSLTIYKDQNSPFSNNFAADTNRDVKDLELLRFVVRADKDTLKLQTVTGTLATSSSGVENVSSVKLVDASGNTLDSVANPGATVVFQGVDFNNPLVTINKDQTVVLRVLADVRVTSTLLATTSATTSFTVTDASAEDSEGNNVPWSGSVAGDPMYLYRVVAAKWEVSNASASTQKQEGQSTTTLLATFVVKLTALEGDVYVPSTTPFSATTTGATSTSMGSPSVLYGSGVETVSGYGYVVRKGNTGTFTLNFALTPTNWGVSGGYVGVILQSMNWDNDNNYPNGYATTNFPGNLETKTRTSDVYLTP